jgi:trehalose 6-phosphate phosphatase
MTERGLTRELVGALHELARVKRLLVALDFDGTLAPEVDDPEQARAIPEARAAVLTLLELPNTRVALVSGRSLASLEQVSDLPDNALLIGSHGIEIRLDHAGDIVKLDTSEIQQVSVLNDVLGEVADSFDQVWLETKPAGFALHTRLATDHNSRVAHLVALSEATAEIENLKVRRGKDVLEFSVRDETKGDALEYLRAYTSANAVFYAGDDITDEDAFGALGPDDLGLKSGTGETLAAHRVAGPFQVAQVLALLAEFRDGTSHEQ